MRPSPGVLAGASILLVSPLAAEIPVPAADAGAAWDSLWISDEGAGHRAKLTVYARRPDHP